MIDTASPRITELRQHEEELVFPAFDHLDAWRLGSLSGNRAIALGHASRAFEPTHGGWLAPKDYTLAGGSFAVGG